MFPISAIPIWCLVKDALYNDSARMKKQMPNLAKSFINYQEEQ